MPAAATIGPGGGHDGDGEGDGEDRVLPYLGAHGDPPAHQVDQLLGDGEPQAVVPLRAGLVRAGEEAREDLRLQLPVHP